MQKHFVVLFMMAIIVSVVAAISMAGIATASSDSGIWANTGFSYSTNHMSSDRQIIYQDFDRGSNNYTVSGINPSWQWGIPKNGPDQSYSRDKVWATNLSGNYNNNEKSYLTSTVLNLSSARGSNIKLAWTQWLKTQQGADFATVEVSKDGGATWSVVYSASGNVDSRWTTHQVVLNSSYAVSNFKVRFGLKSDATVTYAGFYIDTLRISRTSASPTPTPKPSVTPTVTPKPSVAPSATPTVSPKPTATPTATPKPSVTPTATPKPSVTPTATPKPSVTPSATPTVSPKPTATPTATPRPTVTPIPTPTVTPAPSNGLTIGFRASQYGVTPFPSPQYWYNVSANASSKFTGSNTGGVLVIGYVWDDGQCYLNFPSSTSYTNIQFSKTDENEPYLNYFDSKGMKIFLQVEPGNANVSTLIKLVMDRYSHHPCVVGFGIDDEWYQFTNHTNGKPVTDQEAASWYSQVSAYNKSYQLFLKHWLPGNMPPTYRNGVYFVDDSEGFSSLSEMTSDFINWGKSFPNNPVGFQIGYPDDKSWWGKYSDPFNTIGHNLLSNINNTKGIYWVDFSITDLYPDK